MEIVQSNRDITLLRLSGEPVVEPLAASPADEYTPIFSPDGRHFAFTSDETGRWEDGMSGGAPGNLSSLGA